MAKYGILIYALGICVSVIAAAKLPDNGIGESIHSDDFESYLQQQESSLLRQGKLELVKQDDVETDNGENEPVERSVLTEHQSYKALILEVHKDFAVVGIGTHRVLVPRAWVQKGATANFSTLPQKEMFSNLSSILTVGDVMDVNIELLQAKDLPEGEDIFAKMSKNNDDSPAVQYAAAQLWKPDGDTWPDTMFLFNDGVILTILGLALWRLALRNEEEEATETDKDPLKLLLDVRSHVEDLYRSADDLESYQFLEQTKIIREDFLLPISASRQQLINRFGMEKAAELLITISYAERIVNRVSSAATDQHLEEAARCTEEAYAAFQEVYALMKKL